MTEKRNRRRGLSGEAKSKLLEQMKGKAAPLKRKVSSSRNASAYAAFVDFSNHPDYEPIRMQEAFAEHSGLASPFFRAHETAAGATTLINGKEVVNFGSYDYLSLNQSMRVRDASRSAIDEFGTSVSASRLVAGERPFHRSLEARFCKVYESEAALTFVSGHATNVAAISTLVGENDLILYDAFSHNSIQVGAKLSGAARRSFPHNDAQALERILRGCRGDYERVLIIIEGLYSMDGDMPALADFVDVKKRYGAWLMVDEAHGLGVLGDTGRGIAEEQGVPFNDVDIWMGTLSKTLSACGGYIAGCQSMIDLLKYKSAGFVYSVGLSAPLAAAASTGLDIMREEPARVHKLRENSRYALELAKELNLDTGYGGGYAVLPLLMGDSIKAVRLADDLLQHGYNILPIIYPAVPMKEARLRMFINSDHTHDQIGGALQTLQMLLSQYDGKSVRDTA